MIRCRTALSLVPVILATIAAAITAQQKPRPAVRQVDHIVVQTDDPKQLFDVLTGILRLPVASPLRNDSTTAGVGAGNISIELFRPAGRSDSSKRRPQARFTGLAFEPYELARALSELQDRGIVYEPPESYASTLPDGSRGTLWTIVVLPQLSNPGLSVFLYEYSRAFLNVQVRRRQWGGELALSKGGPLGIESVKEIVIGTTSLQKGGPEWQKFFLPVQPSVANMWQAGDGPAIRLMSSGRYGIQGIVLEVRSLGQARDFLKAQHWLGTVSENEIGIAPSAVQGLNIHLMEKAKSPG